MEYRTIAAPAEAEFEEKRSRFIGWVAPAQSDDEARELIAARRDLHPKARHTCTAFVLDPDSRTRRFSDDGEPAGTAGAPILDVLLGPELTMVVCAVTRYFGGTKLGAGGLVRAYGRAASEAVAAARIVVRSQRVPVTVELDYALAAAVETTAAQAGWSTEAEYGAAVSMTLFVPPDEVEACTAALAHATAGAADPVIGEPNWA